MDAQPGNHHKIGERSYHPPRLSFDRSEELFPPAILALARSPACKRHKLASQLYARTTQHIMDEIQGEM